MSPADSHSIIVAILRDAVPGLTAVYLYGSRAHGGRYASPTSDYDVAFHAEGRGPLTGRARFDLANALADALHVDSVDLVDLRAHVGHVLRMSVIDGERLWTSDPEASMGREAKWATMAADFKLGERELRGAQLAKLRERVSE